MKIGVTGYNGTVKQELLKRGCVPLGWDVTSKYIPYDIEHTRSLDLVIHCAALTDVDYCEQNPKEAFGVNVRGTANVIEAVGYKRILFVSSDYVFNGKRHWFGNGYLEHHRPDPINAYGFTKYCAEAVLQQFTNNATIIRTTILYNYPYHKPNFVTKVLDKLKVGEPFEVTTALKGTPTYVPHLAEALLHIAHMENPPKIVHVAGENLLSRYEFALMIASVFGYDKDLIIPTKKMSGIAPRPRNAGLDTKCARKLGIPIYTVLEGLQEMKKNYVG